MHEFPDLTGTNFEEVTVLKSSGGDRTEDMDFEEEVCLVHTGTKFKALVEISWTEILSLLLEVWFC